MLVPNFSASLPLPSPMELDKRTSGDGYGGSGDAGGFPWRHSHIKLNQGAFRGNPPVSLVTPVSLLVGFPDKQPSAFVKGTWRKPHRIETHK